MYLRQFIERVEHAIDSGEQPRPALTTRISRYTPVLAAVMARQNEVGCQSDLRGLQIAGLLGAIAEGNIVDRRTFLAGLNQVQLPRGTNGRIPRLFNVLYGALELSAHETVSNVRWLAGATAEQVLELAAGLGRTLGDRPGSDLGANIAHFMVHAATLLEAHPDKTWQAFTEGVQERLARWGEDPAPDIVIAHAAYNLFLPICGAPQNDDAYELVRQGRRRIRSGEDYSAIHQSWLETLGWRTVDQLLPVLFASERRRFHESAARLVEGLPAEEAEATALRIGLTDDIGVPLIPGSRHHGSPLLGFPGGSSIGHSCVMYEAVGTRICVDFGGDPYGRVPAWSPRLQDVDAVLITHAHHDHIGGLTHLYGDLGFTGPWYADPVTIACTRLALEDSMNLRQPEAGGPDLLRRIMTQATECRTGSPFRVGRISVTGFDAGHVPGSLQFLLETDIENRMHRTLISGDVNTSRALSVRPIHLLPDAESAAIDVLIVEGTNAFREDPVLDGEAGGVALRSEINRQDRFPVLVPVMSLGRAQEVIAALGDSRWRVGVFGLAQKMTRASGIRIPPNVRLETRPPQLISQSSYDVIVASAGCLQGGASRYFWEESGWNPPVILTGYLFPGTPAHAKAGDWARVRYSGHASGREWQEYVTRFSTARKFLVHFPGDR